MAIRYTVTRWSGLLALQAQSHVERQRAPAAATALYSAIYDMLEAEALRDRPVAKRLVAEFDACEVSPPPIGHYRRQVFKLRPDDPIGAYVEFRADRI